MGFNTAFRKRTICEVLREIHDEMFVFRIDQPRPINRSRVKRLLNEALDMAKRMNKKLVGYKRDWDKDMNWEKNLDYEEDREKRSHRRAV